MKKQIILKAAILAAAMFAAGAATADTYYLKSTPAASTTSDPWRAENLWTNALGEAYTITAEGAGTDPNDFVVPLGCTFLGRAGSTTYTAEFPGKTMTVLANGSSSGLLNQRTVVMTFPKLVLDASQASSDMVMIDSNGIGVSIGAEDSTRMITIAGDELEVKTKDNLYAIYDFHGGGWTRKFCIASPLTGTGNLMFRTRYESGGSTTYKEVYLTGDNSGFTGNLCMCGYTSGFDSRSPYLWFVASDANQLGGNPETLRQNGFEIQRVANVRFTQSMVIDQPNRGLYISQINGDNSSYLSRFEVLDGCNVVYTGPWSFSGNTCILQKYGKGLLNLTGGIYPGGANGWFKIYEGTLKLNAQDIATNANLTAKIQFYGGNTTLQLGSNGVARVNPTYFEYYNNTGNMAIVDTATLEVTSTYKPAAVTNITISSQATLSMTGTAAVALNNVTLKDGATLAYHLSSTSTASVPALTINSGKLLSLPETGGIKVKVAASNGLNFDLGTEYILTENGGIPEDAVESGKINLDDGSVFWAKLAVNENGELVVKVADYFYIKIAEESPGKLAVPAAWIYGYTDAVSSSSVAEIAEALGKTGANGIPRWQSYCLGLQPTNSRSVVLCDLAKEQPAEAGAFKFTTNVAIPEGLSGVAVTASLDRKSGTGDWVQQGESQTVGTAGSGSPVEFTADADPENALSFFV